MVPAMWKISSRKNNFSNMGQEGKDRKKKKRKDVAAKRKWEVLSMIDSKIRVLPPNQLLITGICIFIEKFLSPHARARWSMCQTETRRKKERGRGHVFNLSSSDDFYVRGFACLLKTIELLWFPVNIENRGSTGSFLREEGGKQWRGLLKENFGDRPWTNCSNILPPPSREKRFIFGILF